MASNTKPRRKYRPRPVSKNPIALAMRRSSKIPAAEIAEVMAPILAGFRALREGVGTADQWAVLAGSVELALSIEHQGVVRGLQGHLKAAEAALHQIELRAMASGQWKATPLHFHEIAALDEFSWLHQLQMQELSEREWLRAHDRAVALVRNAGGRVLDAKELEGVTA